MLREFTFSIAKNELGLVIGCGVWLIFSSIGSLVSARLKPLQNRYLPLLLTFIFCISTIFIHLSKLMIGLAYYEAASFLFVLLSSLGCLGPVSFAIGYCFSELSRSHLARHPSSVRTFGNFFAFEAIGFFLGGILFTFLMSAYTNPLVFAFLPLLLLLALRMRLRARIVLLFICTILAFGCFKSFYTILQNEFMQATILEHTGSRYGPIIRARQHGTQSLYVNGSQIATSEDKSWNEEFIHMSLSAHPEPKKILFIGPAYGWYIEEMLK